MSAGPRSRVVVHPDKQAVADAGAARLLTAIIDAQAERDEAQLALTGGSMGSTIITSLVNQPGRDAVDQDHRPVRRPQHRRCGRVDLGGRGRPAAGGEAAADDQSHGQQHASPAGHATTPGSGHRCVVQSTHRVINQFHSAPDEPSAIPMNMARRIVVLASSSTCLPPILWPIAHMIRPTRNARNAAP